MSRDVETDRWAGEICACPSQYSYFHPGSLAIRWNSSMVMVRCRVRIGDEGNNTGADHDSAGSAGLSAFRSGGYHDQRDPRTLARHESSLLRYQAAWAENIRWYRPRRASNCPWVPSSTMRPPSSTRMRSASRAEARWYVTMMTVRPAAIHMNRSYTACSSSGSIDALRFVEQDGVTLAEQPACDRQPLPLAEDHSKLERPNQRCSEVLTLEFHSTLPAALSSGAGTGFHARVWNTRCMTCSIFRKTGAIASTS